MDTIKRKCFFWGFILIILIIIILTAVVTADDLWYQFGKQIANLKAENENNPVVAKVNGKAITKRDLDIQEATLKFIYEEQLKEYNRFSEKMNLSPPEKLTRNEILIKLINDEVLFLEAKEQGLEVSTDVAKKFIEDQRRMVNDVLTGKVEVANKNEVIESERNFEQYLKGLGISEDQYWEKAVLAYQKLLTKARLEKKLLSNLPAPKTKEEIEKRHAYIEEYAKNLWKKYNVEILTENLQ